jgi:molybdate transport system regulatory protein
MDHDADFDAHLQAGDVAFTERDATLLRAVDETGSLNEAASSLGRSYSRAHGRLTDLEAAFGDLVERHRGGADGGGSTLTDRARDLLAEYDRLRTGYASVAETAASVLAGQVTGRDGELGTVETDAGTVTAVVPPDADHVEVSVRADAVTLHAPDDTPAEAATSARNRFAGVVTTVERGESISRVTVDVGADTPLYALVTDRSREHLALEPGREVVASFKATATRATADATGTGED